MASLARKAVSAAFDLAVPIECGGCRRPATRWCARCADRVRDDPVRLTPRVASGVPAWAMGRYHGPLRHAVVEVKEHRRTDLVPVLGDVLARGLMRLAEWGQIGVAERLLLVPAPTRRMAARRRGGDPVAAIAAAAAQRLGPRVATARLLVTAAVARDSAGLSAGGRLANLEGAVNVDRTGLAALAASANDAAEVLLVDDVLTTGATAAVAVEVLAGAGIAVAGTVVIAGA